MAITAFKVVGVTVEKKKANISTYSLCDLHDTLWEKKMFSPKICSIHMHIYRLYYILGLLLLLFTLYVYQ